MDKNITILTGTWAAASSRAIGPQGRSLVELRLRVTRPGKKGEGETAEVVPVIVWDATLGAALCDLADGTPLTVVGRISAREWQAPGGQVKTFVEVVAESVTVDAATVPSLVTRVGGGGESREGPSSGSRPGAEPAAPAPSRPSSGRPSARSEVPF